MDRRRKYAYSLKTVRVREDDFPYNGQTLDSPEKVRDFAGSLQNTDIEKFLTLYLDAKGRLICLQTQPGTVDQTAVYPREVAKHAILSGASSVILVHNHPSGVCHPSEQDRQITKTLKEGLSFLQIKVLDHIVIGNGTHYSFAEEGAL